jgi:vitamin B12 transporter
MRFPFVRQFRLHGIVTAGLILLGLVADTARADQATSRVTGQVLDSHGQPATGAEVVIRPRYANIERRTRSDDAGHFVFENLPTGTFLVEARSRGIWRSVALTLELTSGSALTIELRLDRPMHAEQVVVTAEARPQPIAEVGKALSVIDSEQIDRRAEFSIGEAIRISAGVQVRSDGGPGQLGTLRMRGLRPDAAAVLIDGFRFRDVTTLQSDATSFFSNLYVIDTERVEVLRGSASSLYGTNAVGGTVNIVTRTGSAQPGGDAQIEVGQLGLSRARGSFSGKALDGRMHFSAGGLRLDVRDGVDGHDKAFSTGAQGALGLQLSSSTSLWARVWASDEGVSLNTSPSAFEVPVGNFGPGPVSKARVLPASQVARLLAGQPVDFGDATFLPGLHDPDDERDSGFASGAFRLTHQRGGRLGIDASYQRLHTNRSYLNRPGGAGFQPLVDSFSDYTGDIDTINVMGTWSLVGGAYVTGGYEFERESYASTLEERVLAPGALAVDTRVRQDAHSLLARGGWASATGVSVAASARVQTFSLDRPLFRFTGTVPTYDNVLIDSPPTAVTGDVAVSYLVSSSATKLRVHLGNAYRAPSLYERFGVGFFANPAGPVGFTPYGDPLLEPDRYVSFDAGVDQDLARGRGRLRATWFYARIRQVTDFSSALDAETDPYGRSFGYINGDGGVSRGLELEGDLRAGPILLTTAYTFTDARNDVARSVPGVFRAFGVARHTFAAVATARLGERLEIVSDLFARSPTTAPFFTLEGNRALEFPSTVKLDLGTAYIWRLGDHRRLRVYGKVDNALDREYYELGWLAPGATLIAGVVFVY